MANADSISGIVLNIDDKVLANIEKADKAIAALEKTSRGAAGNIEKDFGVTMPGGVDKFIKALERAQTLMGSLKVPTMDTTGLSKGIADISAAVGAIDKSVNTGAGRLTRIAAAISSLTAASPAPDLFQRIADGINIIGATSDATVAKVSTLAAAMATLARDIRTVRDAERAGSDKTAKASQYNKLYKEQAELVRQRNELERKGTAITSEEKNVLDAIKARYAEIAAQIDKLNRKRQTAASELAALRGENRVSQTQNITTVSGAISYAQNAKSVQDMIDAMKNLKAVMATVDPKSAEWQRMNQIYLQLRGNIDGVRRKMGELQGAQRNLMGASGQLARALAGMFSVSAITGYMNKLIEVRAQLELQQTALRAILQDKDEADRIYAQVQQLALQSPFSIMQMTTYTKQMAAYRVEADKLVGTTKMLADVSAGLGVDMQRLILAYGQVKAANYLRACLGRGTKVRMFDGTFKNVEDVVVGDVLIGDDEQPRHVSRLYQGEQQMYRVTYKGGEFRCNEHHILTVYDALCDCISDVFVTEVFNSTSVYRYQGVRRADGKNEPFFMEVEKDTVDTYYGFSIDGNHRFIIEDNIVTHNTEIRQFTEAGLNIAGELATYFSELKGQAVSVGDVMDMVTKRMVRFEDVEEVFKRVTSAGGLFYDMQKKQSETLWGQMQRIKDAMDIMLNEIGKSNQGAISSVLETIREMLAHWRTFSVILRDSAIAFGAYKTATMLAAFANSSFAKSLILNSTMLLGLGKNLGAGAAAMTMFKTATQGLVTALKGLAIAAPPALLIAGVSYLIYQFIDARERANAFKEALEEINATAAADTATAVNTYTRLADTVASVTASYDERKAALDELNRTYGDILPKQALEYEGISKMAGVYTEATNAIRLYYEEQRRGKRVEFIQGELDKNTLDLAKQMNLEELFPGANTAVVRELLANAIQEGVEQGFTDSESITKSFTQKLTDYYNRGLELPVVIAKKIQNTLDDRPFGLDLDEVIKQQQMLNGELNLATAAVLATNKEEEKFYTEQQQGLNKVKKELDDYASALQNLYQLNALGTLWNPKTADEIQASKDALAAYAKARASLNLTAQDEDTQNQFLLNVLSSQLSLNEEIATVSQQSLSVFNSQMQEAAKNVNNLTSNKFGEVVNAEIAKIGGTDVQKAANQVMKKLADTYNIGLDVFDGIRVSAESSFLDVAKQAENLYKELEDKFRRYQASFAEASKNMLVIDPAAHARAVSGLNEEQVKMMETMLLVIQSLGAAMGQYEKSKSRGGRGEDAELKRWQEIKKAIEEANKSFEKYRKLYDEAEARKMIQEQYGKAFEEMGIKLDKYYKDGIYDTKALIEALKVLKSEISDTTSARKKMIDDIIRQIESEQVEIKLKAQEESIGKLKRDIDDLFANYELTKTLTNIGVSADLTFMVGGRPMTLTKLRGELVESLSVARVNKGAEEEIKILEDAMRKLADIENKAQIKRIENYHKMLIGSMGEAAQIQIKAQEEVSKAMASDDLDAWTKAQRKKQIIAEQSAALAKLAFKEFQGSDIYVDVSADLENASRTSLEYVIARLRSMKEAFKDLPADQVGALVNQLERAENALSQRSGIKDVFSNLRDAVRYARQRNTLDEERMRLDRLQLILQGQETEQQQRIVELTNILNGIQDKNSEEYKEAEQSLAKARISVEMTRTALVATGEALDGVNGKIRKGVEAWKRFRSGAETLSGLFSSVDESLSAVYDSLDKTFNLPQGLADAFSSTKEIIGGLGSMFSGLASINLMQPFSIVTGIGKAVGGIVQSIGGVFRIGDKKKERQIKRLQDKVDDLSKAYDRLSDSISEAYTFDDYNLGYEQMHKNLEERKAYLQQMIALENDKKKTDKELVKKYTEELENIAEEEKRIREERYEAMGSTTSYLSEAENFVSAWLDAYKETGDGLDALAGHWDEFFQNLVLKQAASSIVSARLKKYIDQINAAIDRGATGLDLSQMFAQIGESLKGELGGWNEDLKAFFSAVGITPGGSGEYLLSDLQKGIQNITEPQAAAIEAYLNSMRFAVFEGNEIMNRMLAAIQAQYDAAESPVLNEVRAIRTALEDFRSDFRRLMVNTPGRGKGVGIQIA